MMDETREVITSDGFSPSEFAEKAQEKPELLNDLMDLIYEKKEQIRFNSFETLRLVSESNPGLLYPKWNELESLLTYKNSYLKLIGVILLANLVSVDSEGKFDTTFNTFFNILKENVTIVPVYVVRNSWKIVKSKPELEPAITDMLVNLDRIHPGKQLALIKGEAIDSFDKYFDMSGKQKDILKFVKGQVENPSPKARKLAKGFIEKWGNGR
jgi:hypothetical protein